MTRCPACSGAVLVDQRYCLACGERLPGAPAPPATARPVPSAVPSPPPRTWAAAPWPAALPGPHALGSLVLVMLGFGVLAGAAAGPRAEATAAASRALVLRLPAPAPAPAATPAPELAPEPEPEPEPPAEPAAEAPLAEEPAAGGPSPEPSATPAPSPTPEPTATPEPDPAQPAGIRHVFIVRLAGHGVGRPFAEGSPATYLTRTLRPEGTLLERYEGVGDDEPLDPDGVPTLAGRLAEAGLTMRAYQQDLCVDEVERNPLPRFGGECAPIERLGPDLAEPETAPAVTLVTMSPPGEPDGLARADAFLSVVAPAILGSAAYADGGLLLVVFDQGAGDDDPAGALAVSPFTAAGATVDTAYDHLALLRTLSRIFGVEPPGRAGGRGVRPFGDDVWTRR